MSVLDEQRITLAEAAQIMGVHVQTIVRWHLKGVRGIRLSTVVIGALRYTSRERLEEFIRATTAAANAELDPGPETRTPRQREQSATLAEKQAAALGVA